MSIKFLSDILEINIENDNKDLILFTQILYEMIIHTQ